MWPCDSNWSLKYSRTFYLAVVPPGNNRQGIALKRLVRLATLNINIYQPNPKQNEKFIMADNLMYLSTSLHSSTNSRWAADCNIEFQANFVHFIAGS